MGGATAFGYEYSDGTIQYFVTTDYNLEGIYSSGYLEATAKIPLSYRVPTREMVNCQNTDDYFSEARNEEEDTAYRVLYKLTGETIIRRWGDYRKEFVFRDISK
jgi:hypothetical protein